MNCIVINFYLHIKVPIQMDSIELVKAGSVAVEYVAGLKDSVMEDDIGTEVVDATSAVVTNGYVVEHDEEQEKQLEVEGMGAIETALLVVGDECSQ